MPSSGDRDPVIEPAEISTGSITGLAD